MLLELHGTESRTNYEERAPQGENVVLGENVVATEGESSGQEPALYQNYSVSYQWLQSSLIVSL